MKFETELRNRRYDIDIDENAGRFRLEIDERVVEGEVVRPEPGVLTLKVGDRVVEARVSDMGASGVYRVDLAGGSVDVRIVDRKHRHVGGEATAEGRQTLITPMPGKVVDVLVAVGDTVAVGQGIVVVEAMKMQNEVKSPKDGVVAAVPVTAGDTVIAGQVLAVID